MKKVFIKTFGCQMNVRDSEVICGILEKEGFKITDNEKIADVILINTCAVRQHAEDRVWSEIGSHKKRMVQGAGCRVIIGLIGCMAQNYQERAFERAENIDFVVGPQDIEKIPEIIKSLSGDRDIRGAGKIIFERKIWETDGEVRSEEIYHTGFYQNKEHAFVVISEGCENFCSYCVVPYVRGKLRHRAHEEIIKEIKQAIKKGITKFTLLGQNVNAYKSQVDFIGLLDSVNKIKGLKEFGFMTSHPKDTSIELIEAINKLDKLKKCLHLPIQSGSDKILKLMNRKYTAKSYMELAKEFRKIVKGGLLSTDIIVGFPGESEKDFKATYDLMKKLKFNAAYIFKYSPRPRTEAVIMVDDVSKEEKERRHKLILELQRKISKEKK